MIRTTSSTHLRSSAGPPKWPTFSARSPTRRRLMILCKLVEWGEANVGTLAEAVDLSQSALSQHLAKMRDEGLITFRRESQTLWYRIADPRIEELFATLHRLYCRPVGKINKKGNRT